MIIKKEGALSARSCLRTITKDNPEYCSIKFLDKSKNVRFQAYGESENPQKYNAKSTFVYWVHLSPNELARGLSCIDDPELMTQMLAKALRSMKLDATQKISMLAELQLEILRNLQKPLDA
jgi:hypothetical protein